MKKTFTLLLILLLPTLLAAHVDQSVENRALVLNNVNVIDATGASLKKQMTVVIEGNRIAAIGKKVKIPKMATVINAHRKYLIPGLIDTHVHLNWHLDKHFALSTDDQLRLLYLPNGITSVRDAGTIHSLDQALKAREEAKRPDRFIPRIFISGNVDGGRKKQFGLNAGELTRRHIASGLDAIKIGGDLSLDEIRETVSEARKAGKPVWGHTYSFGKEDHTPEAVLAGIQGVTHVLGFPQVGSTQRPDPRPDDPAKWQAMWIYFATNWLYTDEEKTEALIRSMVKNNVWLEPTLVTEKWVIGDEYFRNQPTVKYSVFPYEKMRAGFPNPTGEDLQNYTKAFNRMKDFVRRFHEAGGLIITGSDGIPHPGFGVSEELGLLVEAGLSPMAALQAATRNAARALGSEAPLGTVEVGKQADLVLLEANPLDDIKNTKKIYAVVTRGRFLSKESLEKMLAEAGAAISKGKN
jgi:imidazolonepropionase-like amidohydrolase